MSGRPDVGRALGNGVRIFRMAPLYWLSLSCFGAILTIYVWLIVAASPGLYEAMFYQMVLFGLGALGTVLLAIHLLLRAVRQVFH